MSVSYGGDSITFADGSIQSGALGNRNRIINGAMVIDQRNSGNIGYANTSFSPYTVDRWCVANGGSSTGNVSFQQSSTVPTTTSPQFTKSLAITVTTTKTLGTNEYLVLYQAIEGNNFDDLRWGTAQASTITISFWVRSSVTGTYTVALRNAAGGYNRSYPATYTINSANTWEYKTILVPGDQSGTWAATNGAGVQIAWDLGSGSGLIGTANTWNTGGFLRASSQTNWINNAGATFFITGVQVESGSTASSFEYRPYGEELALCQRYYTQFNSFSLEAYQGAGGYVRALNTIVPLPVEMRATPTRTVITTGSNSIIRPTVTDYSGLNPVSSKHLNAFLETNNTTGTASISGRTESFSAEL